MQFSFSALIFDFDGVIADTMDSNYLSWQNVLLNKGVEISKSDYFMIEGRKPSEVVQFFLPDIESEIEIQEICKLKKDFFLKHFSPNFYPGIIDFISYIKNQLNIKIAVVTGGAISRISKMKDFSKLDELVDIFITADDVENGKPNPEPYLMAANNLSIKSNDCLVIENAPLGISSAKKAGMSCYAICTTLGKEYLSESDKVFSDHITLYNFFKNKE